MQPSNPAAQPKPSLRGARRLKRIDLAWLVVAAFGLFVAFRADAAELDLAIGGVSNDRLAGIGGAKATSQVTLSGCRGAVCGRASAWHVIEGMDDDIGIVPESGTVLQAVYVRGYLMGGVRREAAGSLVIHSAIVGLKNGVAELGLLLPLAASHGEARVGISALIRAPLTKRLSAVFSADYTGAQSPDQKIGRVGVGLGWSF